MLSSAITFVFLVATSDCLLDVDLGYEVNENSMRWLTENSLTWETRHKGKASFADVWYEAYAYCTPEHLGTHIDAPSHFQTEGWTVSDIPLQHLIGQGVVIDITEKVAMNPSAEMTEEDLTEWIKVHGPLPDGAIVFVYTGWGNRYGNQTAYFGTPTNDTTKLVFPGIHISAAQFLTGYEKATNGIRIFGVGIDTASLDHGPSRNFPTHVELATANIYGLENVANLEKLPVKGFEVIVMPIKLTGGSGGQTRIVARLPQRTKSTTNT